MVDHLPQSTAELLSAIDREWRALWGAVGRLTPEQMITRLEGGWSPKDHLAHLLEWIRILVDYRIAGRPAEEAMGLPAGMIERWDFDEMNAALFERDRKLSIEGVSDELKRAYAEVTGRLSSMPFETLIRVPETGKGQPRLLERVLGYTAEHFAEHRATIEATL
jgi:hypothetical protein